MTDQGQNESFECQISGEVVQTFFLGFRLSHQDFLLRNGKQLQLNLNFEKICDEPLSRDTECETYSAN